jgi:phage FluMu protein Com
MVRKRCNKILTELEEGNYLPKKLAKAMSVVNLYQKQKLRSVSIFAIRVLPLCKRNYIFSE